MCSSEDVDIPTVKVNNITMYYEIHGQGEPVVLIAGLNSDHTLYQKVGVISRLAESYQVVVRGAERQTEYPLLYRNDG
jgi:hypothetical protein